MLPYKLLRPLLFSMDAETAHGVALSSLNLLERIGGIGLVRSAGLPESPVTVFGLTFPNPVGLAAGFDKNGSYIDALGKLGFGFLEIGTVTPRPQPGNPRPRLFRLPTAEAIINRMGFNNHGVDALVEKLQKRKFTGILGVNLGKNFDTPNERAADDYVSSMRKVYPHASFLTVNISSPNTSGLRDLQQARELEALLETLLHERQALAATHGRTVPLVVKVAPDMAEEQISDMSAVFIRQRIDGIIATNTTLGRSGVEGLPHAEEKGGLSGKPLTELSTEIIKLFRKHLGPDMPIIGVGGISSAADARQKLAAGANLVQLYSGFVYRGPDLIREIVQGIGVK